MFVVAFVFQHILLTYLCHTHVQPDSFLPPTSVLILKIDYIFTCHSILQIKLSFVMKKIYEIKL